MLVDGLWPVALVVRVGPQAFSYTYAKAANDTSAMDASLAALAFCLMLVLFFFRLSHVALYEEAHHARVAVSAHGDGLLEVAWETSAAFVRHLYLAFLPGLDGSLGVGGYGAAAAAYGLVDNQGRIACVGECERTLLRRVILRERAEVMHGLVELYLGYGALSHRKSYVCYCNDCKK